MMTEEGVRIPVTHIAVAPAVVAQVKSMEKDGYVALQLGFGKALRNITKPLIGHLKQTGKDQKDLPRFLREVSYTATDGESIAAGSTIAVDTVFAVGDTVAVTGTSKGKGFAGVVKRHGFHGGPKTHGQSDRHRAPGSIGAGTTPGRVYKGKRMAGRMGSETITTQGLKVIAVDPEKHIVIIKGLIPGNVGGFVQISKK